jgi:octaprenyl-diphosphate synthase
VKTHGGLEYAKQQMKDYQQKALGILDSYPNSPYKDSLKLLVNYVIDRKR